MLPLRRGLIYLLKISQLLTSDAWISVNNKQISHSKKNKKHEKSFYAIFLYSDVPIAQISVPKGQPGKFY